MHPAFKLVLAFVTLAVAPFAAAENYAWKNVVIKGGGFVSGLVYHPNQRDVLYARTDVGGAFRWQASDSSWVPLNDDIGGLNNAFMNLGVVSLALDARDANRVYLACGQYVQSWAPNATLLASSDRGATWTRTTLPFKLGGNEDGRSTGERLQVDPNDGRILLLGTNANGLWRSTDRGANWTQLNALSPSSVTAVLFDPRTGTPGSATSTIFAGVNTTSAASLYRSTDGGTSWTEVGGQPSGLIPHHLKLSADGVLYLTYCNALGPNGASSGAVWKYKISDGSWTNITPPIGQGGFAGLALDPQKPGTLLVTTLDRWSPRDEIYRSTDDGASWKGLNALSVRDSSSAPYSATSTPHWIGAIELDPFNSDSALYDTGYGLFRTVNLTAADSNTTVTWAFANDGLEETVPLGLVSPPTGAPLVSVIGDIDGFRHDDLAVSPPRGRHAPRVGTNNSLDFAELAPDLMVRTHGGGTVRGSRSTDGGATWSYFGSAPTPAAANGQGAIAISADGSRLVWLPTKSAAYFSADSGVNWSASTGGPAASGNSFTPVSDRVNSSKFYIYDSSAGRVYTSTDGGSSFTPAASVPTGGSILRTVPGLEGHLWLATWSGGLYRSTDSGFTFLKIATVQEGNRVGFGQPAPGQPHPAIFLYGKVAGTTGFYRSDDIGATWNRINDDAHQFGYINMIAGDPRVYGRVYLATGGRGIVYGEIAPASASLPAYDWAAFTTGAPGSFQPTALTTAKLTFAAQGLPGWASLDAATGKISGTSTDAAGTVRQVSLRATDPAGNASTTTLNLLAAAPGADLRFANLSTRAQVGTGGDVLIPGIVISGTTARRFLIRAVGPALASFGVAGTLANPKLTLFQGSTEIASNDDWENQTGAAALAEVRAAFTANGAFPLPAGSRDAVLLATLSPGAYTAKIEGIASGTGVALVEIYDASSGPSNGQLINLAARAIVGRGGDVLIPGMVFAGGGARRVLVRAVGPTLATFGVAGALADPELTLYSGSTVLATNDDWNTNANAAEIRATAASVGAFPLPENSKDSALLPTFVQGSFTLKISGKNDTTGVALVELYLVP